MELKMIDRKIWDYATNLVKQAIIEKSKNEDFKKIVLETLDVNFEALYNVLIALEENGFKVD